MKKNASTFAIILFCSFSIFGQVEYLKSQLENSGKPELYPMKGSCDQENKVYWAEAFAEMMYGADNHEYALEAEEITARIKDNCQVESLKNAIEFLLSVAETEEQKLSYLMRIVNNVLKRKYDVYTKVNTSVVNPMKIVRDNPGYFYHAFKTNTFIKEVIPGSPAEKAGIEVMDEVLKEEPFYGEKGQLYTQVEVKKYGTGNVESFAIPLERTSSNLFYQKILAVAEYNYLRIASFSVGNLCADFMKAITEISSQEDKTKGIILDLRNNSGGSAENLLCMLNSLVQENDVISYEKNLPKGKVLFTTDTYESMAVSPLLANSEKKLELPMKPLGSRRIPLVVVLVDGNTASAAEFFVGALQDYNLAFTIGTQTFGKAVTQTISKLSGEIIFDESTISEEPFYIAFTETYIHLPSGRSLHQKGVFPDYQVNFFENEIFNRISSLPYEMEKSESIQNEFSLKIKTNHDIRERFVEVINTCINKQQSSHRDPQLSAAISYLKCVDGLSYDTDQNTAQTNGFNEPNRSKL